MELTTAFLNDRDVRDSSKKLYERLMRQYFNWVEQKGYDLSQITRAEIIQYKKDLLERGHSPHTVGSYLSCVRTFYAWCEANILYPNVARDVKTPRKKKDKFDRQALLDDQPQKVLDYYQDRRDNAIVTIALMLGLRTIEVARADIGDIQMMQGQRELKVHGKGKDQKDDYNIIEPGVWAVIKEYLDTRPGAKPGEPLFTSRSNNSKGKRLTTVAISRIIKRALQGVGLDDRSYTAHSLRHTAGSAIAEHGTTDQVRHTLRHASTNTSLTYTRHVEDRIRRRNSGETIMASLYTPKTLNGAIPQEGGTLVRVQTLLKDFNRLSSEEQQAFIAAATKDRQYEKELQAIG